MSNLWIHNKLIERLAILQHTEATYININQLAIEKDWWVTATLKALFQSDCCESLIFKGGTSLSKGYNIIERFSEDIDLAIGQSFFGLEKTSKSQREKLRKTARAYIHDKLSSQLDEKLAEMGITGYRIENVTYALDKNDNMRPIDSDKDPTVILLHYPSIVEETINYIPPRVKIEISCLSMNEPTENRLIRSFIEECYEGLDSDASCVVRTVVPTRTFLEKIFLLAEEFQKGSPRSVRMSRHLYDLEKLMDSQYGLNALNNRSLYDSIIEHRKTYYALKYVNYNLHNPSTINFIPPAAVVKEWEQDYNDLTKSFVYGKHLSFEKLLKRMTELQNRFRQIQ